MEESYGLKSAPLEPDLVAFREKWMLDIEKKKAAEWSVAVQPSVDSSAPFSSLSPLLLREILRRLSPRDRFRLLRCSESLAENLRQMEFWKFVVDLDWYKPDFELAAREDEDVEVSLSKQKKLNILTRQPYLESLDNWKKLYRTHWRKSGGPIVNLNDDMKWHALDVYRELITLNGWEERERERTTARYLCNRMYSLILMSVARGNNELLKGFEVLDDGELIAPLLDEYRTHFQSLNVEDKAAIGSPLLPSASMFLSGNVDFHERPGLSIDRYLMLNGIRHSFRELWNRLQDCLKKRFRILGLELSLEKVILIEAEFFTSAPAVTINY